MARYTINYLTGDTDVVTNAVGHEWSANLLVITDATGKGILLAPTANVRSVLCQDDEAVTG
jgi:hypothetical protein